MLALLIAVVVGAAKAEPARRVISLAPSLTAILVALDAEGTLVGIDDFSSRRQPALFELPRVGGLYNPSLEAIVSLQPDLVVLVPTAEQRDLRQRLEALEIPVESFENVRFDQVLENIERLGVLVGRERAARERIAEIRRVRAELEAAGAARESPSVVVVLQRDPLFVVGRGSFIEEMLQVVGAANVAAGFEDAYPRVNLEWLLAAAPEVLIDMDPSTEEAGRFWSRWPALPAVRSGRVLRLDPELVTLPGPDLDRGMQALAAAIFAGPRARGPTGAVGESQP